MDPGLTLGLGGMLGQGQGEAVLAGCARQVVQWLAGDRAKASDLR